MYISKIYFTVCVFNSLSQFIKGREREKERERKRKRERKKERERERCK